MITKLNDNYSPELLFYINATGTCIIIKNGYPDGLIPTGILLIALIYLFVTLKCGQELG